MTDDGQTIARETSRMQVGEAPRWWGLVGGDYRTVPSTSAHAVTVIEPVREAVDEFRDMDDRADTDPDLAAALDIELTEW